MIELKKKKKTDLRLKVEFTLFILNMNKNKLHTPHTRVELAWRIKIHCLNLSCTQALDLSQEGGAGCWVQEST